MGGYDGTRVLVTGGAGLVGSAFVARLLNEGARVRTVGHVRPVPRSGDLEVVAGDLTRRDDCLRACRSIEAVVHAAGVSGGSKNVTVQGIPMYTENLLMNTQMLEAARLEGVKRYLFISNSSVYAPSTHALREEEAWGETTRGFPENETGMVKRAGETQCSLYSRFTEMRIAIIRAGNAYGAHDNFDLEASHVVPALIRKAVEGQNPYDVWGSPEVIRDFIHSDDIAAGGLILLDHARAGECFPVNIASGSPITIGELVNTVLRVSGHRPQVRFGVSAPTASAAKLIDVSRMHKLGFAPTVGLADGLRRTIDWYRQSFVAPGVNS